MVGMFVGVHMLLADKTNCPELIIPPDEASGMLSAAQNVLRHYSVETTQKSLDWIAFAGIVGGGYLMRAVAISNRLGAEKRERFEAGQGGALQFRPKRGVKIVPEAGAPGPGGGPGQAPAAQPPGADLSGLKVEPGMGGFAELEPG